MLRSTIGVVQQRLDVLSGRLNNKQRQVRSELAGTLRVQVRKTLIRHWDEELPNRHPGVIQIEPTSKCNLRCGTCPHSWQGDAGEHLGRTAFLDILDRLPTLPDEITLSGIGEPLLNPGFFDLVDVLSARGIRCRFFTNGTLLSPRVRAGILSRANISCISISCDSADRKTFEALRVGAKFDRWRKWVRQFLAESREHKLRYHRAPYTSMFTVLSKANLANTEEMIRFAKDLGFHALVFFQPIPLDDASTSLCPSNEDLSGVDQRKLVRQGKRMGVDVEFCTRRSPTPPKAKVRCTQPWDYVFIRAGGNVAPCRTLVDAGKAPVMGNLFEQQFMDIWHGDRFREFRRTSAQGTNELCLECPYY